MAKKAIPKETLVAYMTFLIGLTFLIESTVLTFVLGQLPGTFVGSTAAVAWVYALIKFLAGLLAIYVGVDSLQKKK